MEQLWFSTELRTVCFVDGVGAVNEESCIHLLHVPDRDEAFRRALDLGRGHDKSYLNGDGNMVVWRFAEVVTIDELGPADLDGREVHTRFEEVKEPLPFGTRFTPEVSQPGMTGVLPVGGNYPWTRSE